jgi:hypothetical protein
LYVLGVIVLLATLCGCTVRSQTSLDVITLGKAIGLRMPYANTALLDAEPQQAFMLLVDGLMQRGAQVLVADSTFGILSWCETGTAFVALPAQLSNRVPAMTAGMARQPALWHGLVQGAARIRPANGGTWLYLRAVGREVGAEKVAVSDGSYERHVFKALSGQLEQMRINSPVTRGAPRSPALPGASQPAIVPAQACSPRWRHVPSVYASDIRAKGISMVYPASLEAMWTACLDVIAQYNGLVKASSAEGLIIFTQGIALPRDKDKDAVQQVDVLLALTVEPRGNNGSLVHVAWLAKEELAVNSMPDLSKHGETGMLTTLRQTPEQLAAALIADQLFEQLTTQLFHLERWQDKLARRLPAAAQR